MSCRAVSSAAVTPAGLGRRAALRLLAGASAAAFASSPLRAAIAERPVYKDPRAPVDLRVADLLARMTLEEKVAQMTALWSTKAEVMDGLDFAPAKVSSLHWVVRFDS